MYFKDVINKKYGSQGIIIFVDMDGVIAEYDLNNNSVLDFKNKRPIMTNIESLKELSYQDNIELHVLSICKIKLQAKDKNDWLDRYASFFKRENRHIIVKEENINFSLKELKYRFLEEFGYRECLKKIIVIDDDNIILKFLATNLSNIDLYQDSFMIY